MFFSGGRDETIPAEVVESLYDEAGGARWLIRIADAGHLSLTSQCLIGPASGRGCGDGFVDWQTALDVGAYYLTAMFGHHLRDIDGYADDLVSAPFAEASLEHDRFPQ
jgi:hypothetical protein